MCLPQLPLCARGEAILFVSTLQVPHGYRSHFHVTSENVNVYYKIR